MQIRIRSTGQVLLQHEWEKWVATTYAKSISGITPEIIDSFDSDPVLEGPQASPTKYQTAFADGVEEIEGQWFTKYSVAEMDAESIAVVDANQATAMRKERDEKLSDTDWTQLTDAPVNSAVWATYRQSLRDVPSQSGFPWEVTWPTQPTE